MSFCVTADGSVPDVGGTSQGSNAKRAETRPARPCPFCGKLKVRLSRHLRALHKTEESVRNCLNGSDKEQRAVLKQLKRIGILKYNTQIASNKDAFLHRERQCKNSRRAVVCDGCSGVFSKRFFSSHRKICIREQSVEPIPVAASLYYSSFQVPDDYKKDVLTRFSSDDVGQLCQENVTLVTIGCKLYEKMQAKENKKVEARRSVMADMRRLAYVFLRFKELAQQNGTKSPTGAAVSVLDMFRMQNFNILEQACASYTSSAEAGVGRKKTGLAIAVYYMLVRVAHIVKVFRWVGDDSLRATEVAEFLDVLNSSKCNIIGAAVGGKKRRTKFRSNAVIEKVRRIPPAETEVLPVGSFSQQLGECLFYYCLVICLLTTSPELTKSSSVSVLMLLVGRYEGHPASESTDATFGDCPNHE